MYPSPSAAFTAAMKAEDRKIYVELRDDAGNLLVSNDATMNPLGGQIISLEVHRTLEPSSTIGVGGTTTSWMDLKITGAALAESLEYSDWVQVNAGVYVSGSPVAVPIGRFTSARGREPAFSDSEYRTYTMYDFMGKLDELFEWEQVDTSADVLVTSICQQVGITPPDDLSDLEELYVTPVGGYSMRAQIGWLAALAGCHARIGRTGQMEFVWYGYGQNADTLSASEIPSGNRCDTSRHLVCGMDIGNYVYHSVDPSSPGSCDVVGSANPYMFQERLEMLADRIDGRQYYDLGTTVTTRGNLLLDPGDVLQIGDDVSKRVPLMSYTMHFAGGLTASVGSNIQDHDDQISYNSSYGIANAGRLQRFAKNKVQTVGTGWTQCFHFTIPANTAYSFLAQAVWDSSVNPSMVGVNASPTAGNFLMIADRKTDMARAALTYSGVTFDTAEDYYIWAKASSAGPLYISYNGFLLPITK